MDVRKWLMNKRLRLTNNYIAKFGIFKNIAILHEAKQLCESQYYTVYLPNATSIIYLGGL